MKRILSFGFVFMFLFFASCSEDVMDDINENRNYPNEVESKFILTDAMVSSAFSVTGGELAFYASIYSEYHVGCYAQLYNAEIRGGGVNSSSTFNNAWCAVYSNLFNLKDVIQKCSPGGKEAGNKQALGIAKILTAYNLAMCTDAFGDVPWSEALQPFTFTQPKLDKQEDIYQDVFQLLQEGIDALKAAGTLDQLGHQDVIYNGDNQRWIEFAYGLLARYKLRLSAVEPTTQLKQLYQDVITYANQSFVNQSDECLLNYERISGRSPFYALYQDADYLGASFSLAFTLYDLEDPRFDYLWQPHPDAGSTEIIFANNGDADRSQQVQGKFSISALMHEYAPTYLLSFHELEFIKAEAYVRLKQDAEANIALKNGTVAAFSKIKVNSGLNASEIDKMAKNYFEKFVKVRFNDGEELKEILLQKYIACYESEALVTYADIRRIKAMGGEEASYILLMHPESDKFPLRFPYGDSDVTTNKYVRDAFNATNVFTDNVWWAGPRKEK